MVVEPGRSASGGGVGSGTTIVSPARLGFKQPKIVIQAAKRWVFACLSNTHEGFMWIYHDFASKDVHFTLEATMHPSLVVDNS